MKTFLQEIAETLLTRQTPWENLTVIFPNRRAALYFRRELTKELTTPRWSPTVLTIEEFIGSLSLLHEADKLSLVMRLFKAFKKITGSQETIDQFYYWGEMLLRDFDELDKNLVNAEMLFRDLSNQKDLDAYFDYLTEEQKKFLYDFWQTMDPVTSENKRHFLEIWKGLYPMYKEFKSELATDRLAYAGMIHREVAESIESTFKLAENKQEGEFIFAGFNALTLAEEKIISWLVKNRNAKVFWDEDEFYVNTPHREAGTFFRQYRRHPILGPTFPAKGSSYLKNSKQINLLGVPQKAGQPKLLSQQLDEAIKQAATANQELGSETVIVLPDESLLMPVLYALPLSLKAINVTMGYALVNTPYYSLIDFLFDLHLHKRREEFYYRYVLAVLNHPYVKSYQNESEQSLQKLIVSRNLVYIPSSFFAGQNLLLLKIFQQVDSESFLSYLLEIITLLATTAEDRVMESEFAFHFHRMLSRIQEVAPEITELRMLQRMFRQVARSEKVPFSGEPLKGIQIMGVLETRNLDFENVMVLSLNEGLWPASARQGSYIPHNIRRAYNLPTSQHQDAMYAYLFYRLLQRANKVDLYYNTEPDVLGSGEKSRYLYQLMYETGWEYNHKTLYNPVQLHVTSPISIEKKADVLDRLTRYFSKELTPSTLISFLECRLKFYFKHLIGIREADEVEEAADARMFGNIFHDVMHFFYSDLRPSSGKWQIQKEHFASLDQKLEKLMERAFRKQFNHRAGKEMEYEGHQLIVKEMVAGMAKHVLDNDKGYAPFEIEMLEEGNFRTTIRISQQGKEITVLLGGTIDRVDNKEGTVRIIDYKTGKDESTFTTVASLFDRDDPKRNKAAFQAILYAWVYSKNKPNPNQQLQPGLINRKEIFKKDFEYGLLMNGALLQDVTPLLPEFEEHLIKLLTELFDPAKPFDQTEEVKNCAYCPYKEICNR